MGINNLYGWGVSQKIPVNDFKWVEDISEFDESFVKSYNLESDEGYFLKVDVQEPLQWFMLFAWKNENWISWKTYRKLAW